MKENITAILKSIMSLGLKMDEAAQSKLMSVQNLLAQAKPTIAVRPIAKSESTVTGVSSARKGIDPADVLQAYFDLIALIEKYRVQAKLVEKDKKPFFRQVFNFRREAFRRYLLEMPIAPSEEHEANLNEIQASLEAKYSGLTAGMRAQMLAFIQKTRSVKSPEFDALINKILTHQKSILALKPGDNNEAENYINSLGDREASLRRLLKDNKSLAIPERTVVRDNMSPAKFEAIVWSDAELDAQADVSVSASEAESEPEDDEFLKALIKFNAERERKALSAWPEEADTQLAKSELESEKSSADSSLEASEPEEPDTERAEPKESDTKLELKERETRPAPEVAESFQQALEFYSYFRIKAAMRKVIDLRAQARQKIQIIAIKGTDGKAIITHYDPTETVERIKADAMVAMYENQGELPAKISGVPPLLKRLHQAFNDFIKVERNSVGKKSRELCEELRDVQKRLPETVSSDEELVVDKEWLIEKISLRLDALSKNQQHIAGLFRIYYQLDLNKYSSLTSSLWKDEDGKLIDGTNEQLQAVRKQIISMINETIEPVIKLLELLTNEHQLIEGALELLELDNKMKNLISNFNSLITTQYSTNISIADFAADCITTISEAGIEKFLMELKKGLFADDNMAQLDGRAIQLNECQKLVDVVLRSLQFNLGKIGDIQLLLNKEEYKQKPSQEGQEIISASRMAKLDSIKTQQPVYTVHSKEAKPKRKSGEGLGEYSALDWQPAPTLQAVDSDSEKSVSAFDASPEKPEKMLPLKGQEESPFLMSGANSDGSSEEMSTAEFMALMADYGGAGSSSDTEDAASSTSSQGSPSSSPAGSDWQSASASPPKYTRPPSPGQEDIDVLLKQLEGERRPAEGATPVHKARTKEEYYQAVLDIAPREETAKSGTGDTHEDDVRFVHK